MRNPLPLFGRKVFAGMLFALILVLLTVTQSMVRIVPFRYYAAWLRRPVTGSTAPLPLVRSLRRKIALAAAMLPWRPKCLAQALAGRFVLSACGYSSVLSLGVKDDGTALAAHAWLKSGDLFICGKGEAASYGVVAEF